MQTTVWTTWAGVVPWWYTVVPGKLMGQQSLLFYTVADFFSFPILLRTLFQPWKRDQLSGEHLSLQERFQVFLLNLMARLFGFVMRSIALAAGVVTLASVLLFFFFLWLGWVLAPFVGMALIVLGLLTAVGVFQ